MKKFNIRYDVLFNDEVISADAICTIKAKDEQSALDKFLNKASSKQTEHIRVCPKDIYEVL